MIIIVSKDGGSARHVPASAALEFFRAFRAEMWRNGIKRDPREGDCVLGVRIVSMSV
jgi:hypothetical protein